PQARVRCTSSGSIESSHSFVPQAASDSSGVMGIFLLKGDILFARRSRGQHRSGAFSPTQEVAQVREPALESGFAGRISLLSFEAFAVDSLGQAAGKLARRRQRFEQVLRQPREGN